MKLFLLKNLNLPGAMIFAFGLPIGTHILPNNYDLLFLPIGTVLLMISYYYTFLYKIK